MNMQYEWTKFYRELAAKILEYKEDRESLINKLEKVYNDGVYRFNAYDYSGQKPFVSDRLGDIDPFSIFGNIHKYGEKKRVSLLEKYKRTFDIKAVCPEVFPGVPRFIEQANLVRFTNGSDSRGENDIEVFWSLFELGYRFNNLMAKNEKFKRDFDNAEPLPWAKYNVTKVLFYINPTYFVSLDSNNLNAIKEVDSTFKPKGDSVISAEEYLSLCLSLKENYKITDFVDFSATAYSSKKKSDGTTKDNEVTYWIYAPGEKAYKWDDYYSKSLMGIGWGEIGDAKKASSQTDIQKIMKRKYKGTSSYKNASLAVWQFANEIKEGDIIFAKNGQKQIIGRGIVKSDYYYDPSTGDTYNHLRQVSWTDKGSWQYPNEKKAAQKTLTEITDTELINSLENLFEVKEDETKATNPAFDSYIKSVEELLWEAQNIILHGAPGTGKTYLAKELAKRNNAVTDLVQFHPSYDYTDFVEGLRPIRNDAGEIAFERKNGIFKEFCKNAAYDRSNPEKKDDIQNEFYIRRLFDEYCSDTEHIIQTSGPVSFSSKTNFKITKILRDSNEEAKSVVIANEYTEQNLSIKIILRDFMDYVNGLIKKPNDIKPARDSQSKAHGNAPYYFELFKALKSFSEKKKIKLQEPEEGDSSIKHIFIIDEINRGEISKIFGELFFAIDPSYRGEKGKVKTQYQNLISGDDADLFADGFYVPKNVYIIGTMNNIDRSVESMDFAMRRRFNFKEITAEESADNFGLGGNDVRSNLARSMMNSLNEKINDYPTILGNDYQLGANYFSVLDNHFKYGDAALDTTQIDKLWNYKLEGLLNEYLRGEPNKEEIMQQLKEAYLAPYDNYTKDDVLEQ